MGRKQIFQYIQLELQVSIQYQQGILHLTLQNQTLGAEFLKCFLISFTSSLKIHFYPDLFLDEGTFIKQKWHSWQPDTSLLRDRAIQTLTRLKPGQVDTTEVSIT